jgi:hypothetical protein
MQGHEPKDMDTELDLLSDRARASGAERIENVARLLSPANLKECLGRLKRRRAAGTDGVTLEEYEEVADTALPGLVERMKRMSYKPQPVRRVYIRKRTGRCARSASRGGRQSRPLRDVADTGGGL